MAKDSMPPFGISPFGIPPEMRSIAEQSVEQAKTAFNTFINAAHETMNTFEGQTKATQAGAKGVSDQAMGYAERNVAAAFEFAQKLVRVTSVQELVRLQTEFVEAQIKALSQQAKELGEAATKTGTPRKS